MGIAKIIEFRPLRPVTDCAAALLAFLNAKTAARASARTCADYRHFIRQFFTAYPAAWNDPAAMRYSFMNWIAQPDIAPATYNLRLIYLRAFWHWCTDEGIQPPAPDPFRDIKRRPDAGKFRDIDAAKVKELLAMPDRKTWIGLRDYALILFTLDTATRPGEALQLTAAVIPSYADDLAVAWRSTDPSVAVVDDAGEATAVGSGECDIIVTGPGSFEDACHVTVDEK